ncbi:hypothetical protein FF38_14029 [Lucilia cuprina]|uniref:Uncharacterized protein n=1 Tax=Lucilia cuprina TaxID=7375 RepID=A0A0L0C1A6_LUCCU|nr:hypothetical protein FF38_14029 [Lucilia cuprina]
MRLDTVQMPMFQSTSRPSIPYQNQMNNSSKIFKGSYEQWP